MLKKCLSIIMVCFVFCATMIPTYAEENAGTGCGTCNIGGNNEDVQEVLEEVLNYTDEEKNTVMNSVEDSPFYAEHSEFIENSDRVNIYKNDTNDSYFTVTYIHKNNKQVTGTLLFEVNREYKIEEVVGARVNEETGDIVLYDYMKNTEQTYAARSNIDCYTIRCSKLEPRGPERNQGCEILLGFACDKIFTLPEPVVSSMLCMVGVITICQSAPAGMYCAQLTRVNVCPY
ncbi:hypothetical protein [uncultured Dubosiella sp.]|uniref:hypothetical protein n=1 Tax=uncultured Dubosiella sp. TaxID=1937011 RepID=UPI002598AEB7|nr:hypothetical protein [uncultured Dubosiella sp.]